MHHTFNGVEPLSLEPSFNILYDSNINNLSGGNIMILATGTSSFLSIMVVYAVLIGGFWFLVIRPQKNEQRRLAAMIAEVATGDSILTTSGFYGTVIDVTDEDVIVEFGNNKNCRIPMKKAAIAQVEKVGQE